MNQMILGTGAVIEGDWIECQSGTGVVPKPTRKSKQSS